jgi:predicted small lipoprotein YifL
MNVRTRKNQMPWRSAAFAVVCLCVLCACGQKGALYLPDRGPQPVISPPAAPPAVPAEVPVAPGATGADGASTTDTPTTRKAPRDPDPATAR